MSVTVNPNMTPDPSQPDDASPAKQLSEPESVPVSTAPSEPDEGWQTVDFPGAISVDSIPLEIPPVAEHTPASSTVFNLPHSEAIATNNSADLITQLQQENSALRTQVAQLEADLSQVQIELQLEVARFYCKEAEKEEAEKEPKETASRESDRTVEDQATLQEQLLHLTQELTTSQQTVQQQQSLIDTLSTQLEISQQRIAQLERDCALSQQRYNEQLQLVSQAENTCRDLRMRLHRQQQQTLQFKAALEKSIELHSTVEAAQSEPALVENSSPATGTTAFIPKAQPVRPWSTPPANPTPHLYSIARQPSTGLPNLLLKLVKQEAGEATAVSTETTESASGSQANHQPNPPANPELEDLFPTPVQPAPAIADPQPPQESVFDLSPFIEAGELDANRVAVMNQDLAHEAVLHPTKTNSEANNPSGDTLWNDLARLIEPELSAELSALAESSAEAIASELSQTAPESTAPEIPVSPLKEPDISAFASAVTTSSHLSFSISEQKPSHSAASTKVPAAIPQNPFPSFTLRPSEEQAATQTAEADSSNPAGTADSATLPITEPDSPLPPNWPSPILYPFRQPKKLKSMAAVDLPSFPRG
ncbi:hypothetical protein OsccyDRAFT_1834 [Leptolyngbyaceae cyanobacterium JSC-12]|nr:hypothetical protein OsccyDRAFT_1834 [Leptolyngbyaceae cyanobacterium JSC-12]